MREKAYFKRYVNIHTDDSEKNYLKLYDAVEGMKNYQKGDLKKAFTGTSIEKYLSSEVNYLKNKLLTSLISFHSNTTQRNKLQKGILSIEILIVKGFRKEAMKKLKFFKKIAYRQEEFSSILQLIELEEAILFREGIIGFKNILKNLKEERNTITAVIQNLNDLRLLREEVRELQFTDRFITNDFQDHKDLYKNPILETDELCLSIRAKEHWYYIHALKNFLKRNFKDALKVSKTYITFLEERKNLFHVSKLLPATSNYLYFAAITGNKKSFKIGIEKLYQLSHHSQIDEIYVSYIQYSRQLEFAHSTKDKILMETTLGLSIELIKQKSEQMGTVQISYLFLQIVRATIYLNKFELGVSQLNEWYQRGVLKYLALPARLFSLIIHYELKWMKLVESEIVLLKKMKKEFQRDKDVINAFYIFFKNELKRPKDSKQHTIEFQMNLKEISKDKESNFAFEDFDFYQWSLGLN